MKATSAGVAAVLTGFGLACASPAGAAAGSPAQPIEHPGQRITAAPGAPGVHGDTPAIDVQPELGAPRWERLSRESALGPRSDYPMAYHAGLGVMVLYVARSSQTWTWDGSTWERQFPEDSPSQRYYTDMAYDPIRDEIVLFGGWYEHDLRDTWIYRDGNWTYDYSPEVPLERQSHMMAFDPQRGEVVLFGGLVANEEYLDDTWAWDGDEWHELESEHSPTPRIAGALAYDPTRDALVLFGGQGVWKDRNDTWVWDGVDWTRESPRRSPSPREGVAAATFGRHVALFSGVRFIDGVGYRVTDRHTWLLKAHTWKKLSLDPAPRRRHGAMFAWDTDKKQAVLYGGTGSGNEVFSDTWTLRRGQ